MSEKPRIYLDHNLIDDAGKGLLSLRPSEKLSWVYSNEHFVEITRAGDTRFLDTLASLNAARIELVVDANFRITKSATHITGQDPWEAYEAWTDANADCPVDTSLLSPLLARIVGADNTDTLHALPEKVDRALSALLESAGICDGEMIASKIRAVESVNELAFRQLAERHSLEDLRAQVGLHGGRADKHMSNENPLAALWAAIEMSAPTGVSADQFFGFDPPNKQGYVHWPEYLGMTGCYIVLNMIGMAVDQKFAKPEKQPSILSDAAHVGYGAYCDCLMSADRRMCRKASAIYRFRNCGTVVLHLKY